MHEILKEAQKAIERLRQREDESVHDWADELARSDVELEESLPEKDKTYRRKGIQL